MGWACEWRTKTKGIKTQCMRLQTAGKAEGKAELGDVKSADACEAYCCRLRDGVIKDGSGHSGPCDTWQWAPFETMKAVYAQQTSNCFVGVPV